ncbi:MAG: deaminase [Micromonosporaceae bacterium]
MTESVLKELSPFGYAAKVIKISDYFDMKAEPAPSSRGGREREDARISRLIEAGNEFCRGHEDPGAVASLAVLQIRAARRQINEANGRAGEHLNEPIAGQAYIVHSLKRPEEVYRLRQVYGPQFVLLGCQDTLENRTRTLTERLDNQRGADAIAAELIARDADESDKMGQAVNTTYPMADYFLPAGEAAERAVSLLFAEHREQLQFHEYAMYLAHAAKARSRAPSRRVGAVIADERGEGRVLAIGCNDVLPDEQAEVDREIDTSERLKTDLMRDTLERLHEAGYLSDRVTEVDDQLVNDVKGKLDDAKLLSIIEFQPSVHAEAAAVSDAAYRGIPLANASMFVTTYPCHLCFKAAAAAGIAKVYYIDPYPKSRAEVLFPNTSKALTPYVGISPLRCGLVFLEPPPPSADLSGRLRAPDKPQRNLLQASECDPFEVSKEEQRVVDHLKIGDINGES